MKALAIDSSASCMTIAAKNGSDSVTLSLDIGMRQSEKILPAIDYVLDQAGLQAAELDYMTLCKGPGTFTGLRLAFSALKAISLAHAIPIYAVGTLEAYAAPFAEFPQKVISIIDAKKDQFFAAVYQKGQTLMEAQDATVEQVLACLTDGETVITAGPDGAVFAKALQEKNNSIAAVTPAAPIPATGVLFTLAEEQIAKKLPALQEYEGPAYLRKSEAELALERGK
ncbi:MAG: tRNA (adenosine(37)-N6)-threonylcarbamoyltransferase complex dimerization subunit type 1 TsaB [Treponema sp.]|nr:tRNA (adenosine(37)-N6)-threonylcarbamoyltransferase complex dimerization subunit type 1 TsaB [Treponema sp.]